MHKIYLTFEIEDPQALGGKLHTLDGALNRLSALAVILRSSADLSSEKRANYASYLDEAHDQLCVFLDPLKVAINNYIDAEE